MLTTTHQCSPALASLGLLVQNSTFNRRELSRVIHTCEYTKELELLRVYMNEGYALKTYYRVAKIFTHHAAELMPDIEHVLLFSSMDALPLKLSKKNDWKLTAIGFTIRDFFGDIELKMEV